MLLFFLNNWKYVVIGVLVAAVSFYAWRAEVWQDKYYTFVAKTEALGKAAEEAARAKEMADKLRRDMADAENKVSIDKLNTRIASMRKQHTYTSRLPAAPSASSRPDLICLDRSEYQREDGAAFKRLREGARSLADEGSKNTVDIDTARRWAQGR